MLYAFGEQIRKRRRKVQEPITVSQTAKEENAWLYTCSNSVDNPRIHRLKAPLCCLTYVSDSPVFSHGGIFGAPGLELLQIDSLPPIISGISIPSTALVLIDKNAPFTSSWRTCMISSSDRCRPKHTRY